MFITAMYRLAKYQHMSNSVKGLVKRRHFMRVCCGKTHHRQSLFSNSLVQNQLEVYIYIYLPDCGNSLSILHKIHLYSFVQNTSSTVPRNHHFNELLSCIKTTMQVLQCNIFKWVPAKIKLSQGIF